MYNNCSNHTIKLIILGLFFSLSVAHGVQVTPDYYYKQISLQEGLQHSMVRCVLSDSRGYTWMGTRMGLSRFDRNTVRNYMHRKDDSFSLPDNLVHVVVEDSLHGVWVATEQGLVRYNRKGDNFLPVTCEGKPLCVRSCRMVPDGVLWGGLGCLYLYNYDRQTVEKLPIHATEPCLSFFDSFQLYDANTLLIRCRWNGVWKYTFSTGRMERLPFLFDQSPLRSVSALYVDADQHIWVSPYGKGLCRYTLQGELERHYTTGTSGLKYDIILDILEVNNELWLATDGGGINILNYKTQDFRSLEHKPGEVHSLPVNSFCCLYNDSEGNIWAGSVRGGLIGIKEVYLKLYREAPLNTSYGLSEKIVLCTYEDAEGYLWVGTDGGGVNRFDPKTQTFRHYSATYGEKIVSMTDYSDTELLLSFFGKGLYVFDKRSGQYRQLSFLNAEEHNRLFMSGLSVQVQHLHGDLYRFMSDSVYLYDRQKKTMQTALPEQSGMLLSSLQTVAEDSAMTYLMSERGLLAISNQTNRIRSVYTLPDSMGTLTAIQRDKTGRFWVGTTMGLSYYDAASQQLVPVRTNLFSSVSMLCFNPTDTTDQLWIGSGSLLFSYHIQKEKFILYSESDGVYANEYLNKPTYVSHSGDIYLGGVMGLLRIRGNMPPANNAEPMLGLMDVILDGVSIDYMLETRQQKLLIPWNHTSLAIKVVAHEKDLMRDKIFRYYVEGLGRQPMELYEPVLTLRSVPPGDYRILVSCNKRDGNWSTPIEVLNLRVLPPWWKSNWFIFLCVFVLMGVAGLLFWALIRRKENKLRLEKEEHEKRIDEEKIRFLINISHELRTPLTLIYAPLKRMISVERGLDSVLKGQLESVYHQARHMRNMINMVLDVRKIEVGQGTLQLTSHFVNDWVKQIAEEFRLEMDAKEIRLQYQLDASLSYLLFDDEKCRIVLSNLLMNALKFSEADTTITLSTSRQGELVRIAVSDEGIGLGHADVTQLFSRFYQGNHDRKGSGIGLSYANILIKMHGGRMGAINHAPAAGATFYYELPLQQGQAECPCEPKPYLNELLFSPAEELIEGTSFSMDSYCLLIVEDEPELRSYLKETLRGVFKSVLVASDGVEALEVMHHHQPDIVISDVMMPRMDGFQLCRRIKETLELSHIPVILLTARDEAESKLLGYKLGADLYVAKPFDVDFLLAVTGNMLKNRERTKLRYRNSLSGVLPKEVTISNVDEKFIFKLNEVVCANLSNSELDVAFLTDKLSMSRASLYNKIKALTGMGVNDYINKYRLDRAAQLLKTTDLAIMEVSEQCGFANQRYFSTVFKQAYGSTPSKYRQQ